MKKCNRCGILQDSSAFHKNSSRADGLQVYCKLCKKEMDKNYYTKGGHIRLRKLNASYIERNIKYKLEYLMSHPCVDCGENDPDVLEFDHLHNKRICVGRMASNGYSIDALKEEISKCDVRCVKCHRKKTRIQLNWRRADRSAAP